LTTLLAGCFGQDDTVVEYRLRCTDDTSESTRDCNSWSTADRVFYQLDTQHQTVTRRVEDEMPRIYNSCKIYNLDHWSCAAEIGMGAVEFKQGRRLQDAANRPLLDKTKRVTWFEWWSTWAKSKVFG
jgi:hypothetical protein